MPIYEYKCLECGNQTEAMQKISDEPLKTCPKCSGKLEKQWSRTGFQFKGSGWYVTDYAGKSAKESSTETKSETNGDATKTSSTTESTGGEQAASKPETTSASSDDAKP